MVYPSQPDFTSVSDADAWWLVGFGSPTTVAVCSSGGRAFVDLVQMILGVNPDGRWGAATSAALVSALQAAGASSTLIGGVQAEAAAHRVSISSVKGAIFLMHRGQAFGGGTPIGIDESTIAVQPNAVFPQWDVAAPAGPSGDMPPVCVPRDATAPAPGPTLQPIPSINVTVPPPAPSAVPGPTTGPGKPVIVPAAGSSTGLILGVLAVAAVGGVAWFAMKKSPAKQNPEMTERDRMREREKAKKWFKHLVATHGRSAVGELGDQLVLGDFDWREWFNEKPSNVFMNEVDRQRIDWEIMHGDD